MARLIKLLTSLFVPSMLNEPNPLIEIIYRGLCLADKTLNKYLETVWTHEHNSLLKSALCTCGLPKATRDSSIEW